MKKLKKKKRGKEVNACSNDNNRPSKRAAIIEVMDQDPCEPNANLLDDKWGHIILIPLWTKLEDDDESCVKVIVFLCRSFDRSVVLAGADGQNEHQKKRKKRRQRANVGGKVNPFILFYLLIRTGGSWSVQKSLSHVVIWLILVYLTTAMTFCFLFLSFF